MLVEVLSPTVRCCNSLIVVPAKIYLLKEEKLLSRMYFEGKGSNQIKFAVENAGDYQVCFNNEMARWTPKVVSMRINVEKNIKSGGTPVKPEDIDPLEVKLDQLQDTLARISEEQVHFKYREAQHTATLQSTHSRITYYSLFESFVLCSLALVQIYFVKKWFDTPRSRV